MAIKVNGTTVIDDSRTLQNVGGLKTVGGSSILGSGNIATGGSTTLGAVGTYAMLRHSSVNTTVQTGATVSGSSMYYSSGYGPYGAAGSTAPSGTWQCMGFVRTNSGYSSGYPSVFVRIS